jgi:hypothetical protein
MIECNHHQGLGEMSEGVFEGVVHQMQDVLTIHIGWIINKYPYTLVGIWTHLQFHHNTVERCAYPIRQG